MQTSASIDNSIRSITKLKYIGAKLIIVVLIPLLLISVSDEAYGKKKKTSKRRKHGVTRVYNPSLTKAAAILLLQTSDELVGLAGIDATAVHSKDSGAYQLSKQTTIDTVSVNSDVDILKTYLSIGEEDDNVIEEGENAEELAAEDDIKVDMSDFKLLWLTAIGAGSMEKTSYGTDKGILMDIIMSWLGTPYRFGADTRNSIDCSAWIRAVFYQSDSVILPRTAREQVLVGRKVNRDKLVFGDLVFFLTYSKKFASHVGIYLGDDLFAHASSVYGVTISSLNSSYYANRFIGGRRFSESDLSVYRHSNGKY